MRFTTYEHLLERCNLLDQDGLPTGVGAVTKRELYRIIDGVSARMSQCMNRDIQVQQRVETVAAPFGRVLFVDNPLIQSVDKIEYDPTGLFSAAMGASTLTPGSDYTVDPDQLRINMIMRWPMSFPIPCKPLRITYHGGHAYHTWKTIYNIESHSGTPAPGTYAQEDGSSIIIDAVDLVDGIVTFRPDIGAFDTGNVVVCSTDTVPATITLGDCVESSVVNNLSSLEGACLMQAQYEFERRLSVGKHSTTTGNGQTSYTGEYKLLTEVVERCDDYQLYSMALT